MDFTAPAIQTQPAPANAGTKQLDSDVVLFRQPRQRHIGPRADMLNDLCRGEHAKPPTSNHISPPCEAGENAGGEHVARACRVDELGDWKGWNLPSLIAIYHDAALFRARDEAKHAFYAQIVERFVEVRRLVKR